MTAKCGEFQVCRAKIEAYKATVETLKAQINASVTMMASVGSVQVYTTLKVNALRPLNFHRTKSSRETDNFL